jgi:hypothetical protein
VTRGCRSRIFCGWRCTGINQHFYCPRKATAADGIVSAKTVPSWAMRRDGVLIFAAKRRYGQ